MMKTKLSFLAVCSFMLCTLFLVACDNEEEALTIWDYSPVVCYVAVEDADGHDLLDPQTEGNILGQDIKADFMGDTYELNAEVVQTRYYLARFTGLQLVYGGDEERYYLRFGELAGENTYENEPLTLHWGDGSTDVITVYNRLLIHAQDDHEIVRRFSLNQGPEQESDLLTVTRAAGDTPVLNGAPWQLDDVSPVVDATLADEITDSLAKLPFGAGTGFRLEFPDGRIEAGQTGTLAITSPDGTSVQSEMTVKQVLSEENFNFYRQASDEQKAVYEDYEIPYFYFYMLCEAAFGEADDAPRTYHVFAVRTDAEPYYELWLCEDLTASFQALYPDETVNRAGRLLKGQLLQTE